jgi:hypothetical protein
MIATNAVPAAVIRAGVIQHQHSNGDYQQFPLGHKSKIPKIHLILLHLIQ